MSKPPNEPPSPTEIGLAEHVASQAGLVVRNVRLTAELQHTIDEFRASRRRLVRAQETERQKMPDAARGSGLQGMADRLDAIGGRLEIESEPGRGAVVRGIIDIDVVA